MLEQESGLNITNSSVYNLEIISDRAGKGNGLLALGKLLGISREEIMGIGDSSNDWDMLRKVGFPVVMENADEETKKLGKYITGTNDENGVAQVLQHFFRRKRQKDGILKDRKKESFGTHIKIERQQRTDAAADGQTESCKGPG